MFCKACGSRLDPGDSFCPKCGWPVQQGSSGNAGHSGTRGNSGTTGNPGFTRNQSLTGNPGYTGNPGGSGGAGRMQRTQSFGRIQPNRRTPDMEAKIFFAQPNAKWVYSGYMLVGLILLIVGIFEYTESRGYFYRDARMVYLVIIFLGIIWMVDGILQLRTWSKIKFVVGPYSVSGVKSESFVYMQEFEYRYEDIQETICQRGLLKLQVNGRMLKFPLLAKEDAFKIKEMIDQKRI